MHVISGLVLPGRSSLRGEVSAAGGGGGEGSEGGGVAGEWGGVGGREGGCVSGGAVLPGSLVMGRCKI
jgi:hypothetical protein